tara:strand:+ start:1358 stop:2425 length:1068 start_codon:yes stop_codon:yes gene_type:complete
MSFFENLRRKATGILGDAGDPMGEASMDVNYDPNQTFTSPYFGKERRNPNSGLKEFQPVPFKINAEGKKVAADGSLAGMIKQGQTSSSRAAGAEGLGINNDQAKRFFGMDLAGIRSQWKDKGGFEALMANPMFTLGLGLMKSSATGQPMSQSLLNNAVTAGAISGEYAERIKKRSEVLAPVTEEQRDEVAAVLAEDNYYKPNFLDKMKRGNQSAKYREALDTIYDRAEKIAKKESKSGKSVRFGRVHIRKAIKELEASGKLKKRDPSFFGIISGTVEATGKIDGAREMGGPVTQGKNYLVGEAGPEIFTPKATGKIVSNDDSNVVNMLLEANPQLKNVSLERATKILKNRFPDYF